MPKVFLVPRFFRRALIEAKRRKIRRERTRLQAQIHDILVRQTGLMAMAWATLEATLDGAIAMAHDHGGRLSIQPDLPASLKVKLAYLRKTPRNIERLQHLTTDVQKFVDRIQEAKGIRHDLTHGIVSVGQRLGHVKITRIGYNQALLAISTREVSIEEIAEAVQDIMALATRGAIIATTFAQTFGERELENVYREAAVSISLAVKSSDKMRNLID